MNRYYRVPSSGKKCLFSAGFTGAVERCGQTTALGIVVSGSARDRPWIDEASDAKDILFVSQYGVAAGREVVQSGEY
jgi:hypothetical protein